MLYSKMLCEHLDLFHFTINIGIIKFDLWSGPFNRKMKTEKKEIEMLNIVNHWSLASSPVLGWFCHRITERHSAGGSCAERQVAGGCQQAQLSEWLDLARPRQSTPAWRNAMQTIKRIN